MKCINFDSDDDFKEIFLKANFMLFDQIFWEYSEDFLNRYNVDLIYIGKNFFKNDKNCPLLIDLRKLKESEKEDMYNYICTSQIDAESSLDQMKMSQNIFICDNLEKLKELLSQILIIGNGKEKKLFRVYDPRVSFFLPYLLNYANFKPHKKNILNFFENNDWYINILGGYTRLNDFDYSENLMMDKSDLDFFRFKIRSKNNLNFLNINKFIENFERDV